MALAGSAAPPFGCVLHRSEYALSDKPIASGACRADRFCRSAIRVCPPQERVQRRAQNDRLHIPVNRVSRFIGGDDIKK